jgi:hypothetical protein
LISNGYFPARGNWFVNEKSSTEIRVWFGGMNEEMPKDEIDVDRISG